MVVKSMLLAAVVVGLAIFLSVFVNMQPYATPNYDALRKECDEQTTYAYKQCCLTSVDTMQARLAFPVEGSDCPVYFRFDSQNCLGSFQWCEPEEKAGN